MAHLTLTRVSEDGKRLVLVDDEGREFTLDVDGRLQAAIQGRPPRSGQETKLESSLRPRDIQARIRSGESAEAVAAAAGTTVEKILPFAGPVLGERQHVAERAQRSSVRRRAGEPAGAVRTLGDAVAARLRPAGTDPGSVEWDAWRREDGRWTLTGQYDSQGRRGTAHFTFDLAGNYVVLDDDDARWLVGESVGQPPAFGPSGPTGHDDLQQARQRRLSAIDPGEDPALGDDAIELVNDPRADRDEPAATVRPPAPATPGTSRSTRSSRPRPASTRRRWATRPPMPPPSTRTR